MSHTSGTNSSTHYVMDGYNAMMQKGKSGGNKKIQEFTTTFEAEFKLHKNFNVKADFSYTQGYLHYDYRSVNVDIRNTRSVAKPNPKATSPTHTRKRSTIRTTTWPTSTAPTTRPSAISTT